MLNLVDFFVLLYLIKIRFFFWESKSLAFKSKSGAITISVKILLINFAVFSVTFELNAITPPKALTSSHSNAFFYMQYVGSYSKPHHKDCHVLLSHNYCQ